MQSIRELYKIRRGPSSSHTVVPERAAVILRRDNPGGGGLPGDAVRSAGKKLPGTSYPTLPFFLCRETTDRSP